MGKQQADKKTAGIGKGTPGPGRPKGCPNKATTNARQAIARFVDANMERLQGWMDEIAEKDGAKAALQCFKDVMEFHVAKPARIEISGPEGDPIEVEYSAKSTLIDEILSQVEPQDDPKPPKRDEERRR